MYNCEKTCTLLKEHFKKYPLLEIRDILKFLHQSAFGCEHLVCSFERARDYILSEHSANPDSGQEIEALDGNYSRVPVGILDNGLSADTFAGLFVTSAKSEADGLEKLLQKIEAARELIKNNELPFSAVDFEKAIAEWKNENYPAVRHSEAFRTAYRPAYRVIANEFLPFLPLFTEIDKRLACGRVIVAVEGGSASGKTTLSKLLSQLYGCTVFHMDDFFLQPFQRTAERFKEIGGNVDRERFLSEVLLPLKNGEAVTLRKFDCSAMTLTEGEKIIPEKLIIVEGAYSMHPTLSGFYDFSAFLNIYPDLQKKRILKRNGQPLAQRFFDEWIPMETAYFEKTDIKNRCDMIIDIV